MILNKKNIEKKCCFYTSDFHLEMIIVPYINKKIEENKNIIIVTENKLEETVKLLISRMHIKNTKELCKLDWNNNDIKQIKGKNDLVIIINGTREFINNKNNEINNLLGTKEFEIINCFCFDEIKEEIVEISNEHTRVLNNLQKNY